jgi:hypothetical protein
MLIKIIKIMIIKRKNAQSTFQKGELFGLLTPGCARLTWPRSDSRTSFFLADIHKLINMDTLPDSFPTLPPPVEGMHWSAEIVQGHRMLANAFNTSRDSINLDISDPTRLRFHLDHITNNAIPVLEAMSIREDELLPANFVLTMAITTALLVTHLQRALKSSQSRFLCHFNLNLNIRQLILLTN